MHGLHRGGRVQQVGLAGARPAAANLDAANGVVGQQDDRGAGAPTPANALCVTDTNARHVGEAAAVQRAGSCVHGGRHARLVRRHREGR